VNRRDPITILEVRPQKEATNAGVVQDKSDLIRDRSASGQPYRTPDEIRSNPNHVQSSPSNTEEMQRSNTTGAHPTQLDYTDLPGPFVPLTIQIPKLMKAEIQRLATQEGQSDSYIARNVLGRGLQAHIDMQYGALLKPTIKDAIHDNFQGYNNRTANIGLQTYYAAEQTRILAIHILRFLTDLVNSADDNPLDSPDELPLIIKVAQEEAWKNMTNLHRDKTATPAKEEDDREWQS
jgi:hypothetical protein